MNRLSSKVRASVIQCLVEGCSILNGAHDRRSKKDCNALAG